MYQYVFFFKHKFNEICVLLCFTQFNYLYYKVQNIITLCDWYPELLNYHADRSEAPLIDCCDLTVYQF